MPHRPVCKIPKSWKCLRPRVPGAVVVVVAGARRGKCTAPKFMSVGLRACTTHEQGDASIGLAQIDSASCEAGEVLPIANVPWIARSTVYTSILDSDSRSTRRRCTERRDNNEHER